MHWAAAYVGETYKSFAACYREWGIPFYPIGRHVRFKQSDLDAYLERVRKQDMQRASDRADRMAAGQVICAVCGSGAMVLRDDLPFCTPCANDIDAAAGPDGAA